MGSRTFRRFVVNSDGIVVERVYTVITEPDGSWAYAVLYLP